MKLSDKITESIRSQKARATPAELLMMQKLRYHRIKYCFCYAVLTEKSFFTADFFLPKYNLLIEIDGEVHNDYEVAKKDVIKNIVYKSLGYNVLRIKNEDVDMFDTKRVKRYVRRRVKRAEPEWVDYGKIRVKQKGKFNNKLK